MNRRIQALVFLSCLTGSSGFSSANEWPQFRGPSGDGHVKSAHLPTVWSESHNVTWKTPVAGKGHSSPVIGGNQIWLTTALTSQLPGAEAQRRIEQEPNPRGLEVVGELSLRALCLDRNTGKQIHNVELFTPETPGVIHSTNSYASPTPVIRDGRLFCHFGTYGSACIDTESGKILWKTSRLNIDHQNGPGSSPILWRNLLIAHYDGIDSQSVAALDTASGETVWRTQRSGELDSNRLLRKAYATPTVVPTSGGPLLISPAANWVYAYRPATGSEVWKTSYQELGFSTVPRPVVGHGLAFICTSFPQSRLLAVRYDGRDDVIQSRIAWTSDSQIPKKPSLLLVGDELYVCHDTGIVTCLEAQTGRQLWRRRIGGNYSASPMVSGDHIYFFSEEGKTTVIRAGRDFEQVASNQLDAGFMASPAAADDALFPRTLTHLYRIEDRTQVNRRSDTSAVLTTAVTILGASQQANSPWSARPDVVKRFEDRRGQFNYAESKVPDYTLPNPLVADDGTPVSSAESWHASRRAELLEHFRDQVYGRRPDVEYTVRFEKTDELTLAFDGAATGRSMKAIIAIADRTYSFPFVVLVPNNAQQPVPAVVHINNRYFISLDKAASQHDPFWPAKTLIQRGYATASFYTSDVDPDKRDGYVAGIRSFFANGQPPKDDAWRSLSAWGWAASRILDHLHSLDSVDGTRVAIAGHSRGGKASLWAACEDARFAIAYSNNSGCGGAALSRRAYGETVGRITSNFPHWFCTRFAAFADREGELPIDQHEVMGLIAPRAVYVASADEDLWADPKGEYASVVAAAGVFQLLRKKSITKTEMPPLNQPRVVGQTGYHIRSGGHGLGDVDWKWFLDFADQLLK